MLFCVGATKAGTSWLYRYLHGHPDARLRSLKELHFFDTIDHDDYDHQLGSWAALRRDLQARREAAPEGDWRRGNLQRQIDDLDEMTAALELARGGDRPAALAAYLRYLDGRVGTGGLVADITPGYALLSAERLGMIAGLSSGVRVLYMMRDPVERLWSHVRMQARRQLREGEEVAVKAGRILNRVVSKGRETHVPQRGDYRGAIERLTAAVPAAQLMIDFSERLLTEAGLRRLCAFLGIGYREGDVADRAHEGVRLAMRPDQRDQARAFLAPQYDFVERNYGPLPESWQANWMRA